MLLVLLVLRLSKCRFRERRKDDKSDGITSDLHYAHFLFSECRKWLTGSGGDLLNSSPLVSRKDTLPAVHTQHVHYAQFSQQINMATRAM